MKKQDTAAIWENIDKLQKWKDNPRKNKAAIKHVAESIKRFGFASPIIARADDKMIIAGHTRYEAAKELGLDKVPVRYLDLDPADSRLLALADNKTAELADWDEEKLEQVMQDLLDEGLSLDGLGWTDTELADIVQELKDEEIKEDEAPEPEDTVVHSVLGEIYELGPHRLICGDSTDPATWDKLMQGEKADMVFTDPPYGMNLDTDYSKMGSSTTKYDAIIGDNKDFDASIIFKVIKSPIYYLWGADYYCSSIPNYKKGSYLVWSKAQSEKENDVFGSRFELCWRYPKRKKEVWFIRGINQSSERLGKHPTQKPTSLAVRAINLETKKGSLIADGFGGSGSTLIAAAQTDRRARLVELDPKYCDVIRRRWTRYAKENNIDVGPGGLDG